MGILHAASVTLDRAIGGGSSVGLRVCFLRCPKAAPTRSQTRSRPGAPEDRRPWPLIGRPGRVAPGRAAASESGQAGLGLSLAAAGRNLGQ
jgi:hypothetical protein